MALKGHAGLGVGGLQRLLAQVGDCGIPAQANLSGIVPNGVIEAAAVLGAWVFDVVADIFIRPVGGVELIVLLGFGRGGGAGSGLFVVLIIGVGDGAVVVADAYGTPGVVELVDLLAAEVVGKGCSVVIVIGDGERIAGIAAEIRVVLRGFDNAAAGVVKVDAAVLAGSNFCNPVVSVIPIVGITAVRVGDSVEQVLIVVDVLIIATIIIVVNLTIDLLYGVVNPRIRHQ